VKEVWTLFMPYDRYPKYEAKRLETGGGWYVVLTRPGGLVEKLYGFVTEAQVYAWISKDRAFRSLDKNAIL
jgi:hypothetical protein